MAQGFVIWSTLALANQWRDNLHENEVPLTGWPSYNAQSGEMDYPGATMSIVLEPIVHPGALDSRATIFVREGPVPKCVPTSYTTGFTFYTEQQMVDDGWFPDEP